MKKLIYSLFLVGAVLFTACTNEDKIMIGSDLKAPELVTPANKSQVVFEEATSEENFVIKWNAADYGVATSVTYNVEAVPADREFAASDLIKLGSVVSETQITLKINDLNTKLVKIFGSDAPVNLKFRVSSTIESLANAASVQKVETLYSTPVTAQFTLFAPKNPNDDGTRIYMIGAAVPAGWNPGNAIEMVNIGPKIYQATTTFANDRFRFFGQQDWGPVSYNFPYFESYVDSNFENARQPDREDGDQNLWFNGTPGDYTITVDLNNKTIHLDPVHTDDDTRIYIVGAAVPAEWNPANAVEMVNIAPNVYRAITDFKVDRFRFLAQKDWGPTSYNFPFFSGGATSNLENARQPDREDGDENLWFKGPEGKYIVTVDLAQKTVSIR